MLALPATINAARLLAIAINLTILAFNSRPPTVGNHRPSRPTTVRFARLKGESCKSGRHLSRLPGNLDCQGQASLFGLAGRQRTNPPLIVTVDNLASALPHPQGFSGIRGLLTGRGYSCPVNYRELEEALCRLPTVDAARVVGDNGRIAEVHVLAAPSKPPKQIVRDIQSLAMASFGLPIDRRAISVVQIDRADREQGERPAVLEIKETPQGSRVTASVTLGWQGEMFVGEAEGPSASATRLRLVGEATLRALEQAIGGETGLALAALEIAPIGGRNVAVAEIVVVTGGEERMTVGSALTGHDHSQAAVRAVLDALNRFVPHLRR